jgi:hypothetical protein
MVLTKVYEKFNVSLDGEEYEENTSFFGPKNLKHLKPEIVEPCDDCKLCVKNEKPSLRKYTKGKRKRDEEAFTTPPTSPIHNETAPIVSEPSPNLVQNDPPSLVVSEPPPTIVQDTPSSPLVVEQNENIPNEPLVSDSIPQNDNVTQVSSFSDFMTSSACVPFYNSFHITQNLSSPQSSNPLPFLNDKPW